MSRTFSEDVLERLNVVGRLDDIVEDKRFRLTPEQQRLLFWELQPLMHKIANTARHQLYHKPIWFDKE